MPFQDIKPVVLQAVTAVESLYGQHEAHPLNWPNAVLQHQAQLIWQLTVRRKMPLVWLLRNQSAKKAVFTVACSLTGIPCYRITNGELSGQDFARMTGIVGRLGHAPVRLRDSCKPDRFRIACAILVANGESTYVLCDWALVDQEFTFAKRLAAVSNLVFLCPRK